MSSHGQRATLGERPARNGFRVAAQPPVVEVAERRRYCYPECRDPFFQECADCWRDGGNPALWPPSGEQEKA